MSDRTALPPPMTLISASGRHGADPTATTNDDLAMDLLATWLAEVSAEATRRPPARDAASSIPEPGP